MGEPKPIGVIAPGQSLHSRTLELVNVRIDALERLEGAEVVFASSLLDCHGTVRSGHNGGRIRVLAAAHEDGVEILLPANANTLVPALASHDVVYFADDVGPSEEAKEAAYVAAWKAERRAKNG